MRYCVLVLVLSQFAWAGEDALKPPERKPLEFGEQDDVSAEVFVAAVKRLYDEYVSEDRRMAAVLKPDNSVSVRTNHGAIIGDMAELMWRDDRTCLGVLLKMPEQTVVWPQWENRQSTVSPDRLLGNVMNAVSQRVRRAGGQEAVRQLKKSWDALERMILERSQPPNAEEWRALQGAAKDMRAHVAYLNGSDTSVAARMEFAPVTFIFSNACLADILNTAAIQCDLKLTFEPAALREEIIKITVEGRMEVDNESAKDVFKKLLDSRGLSYRLQDDPKDPHLVISRKPAAPKQ